jgi:hypothetical protein
MKTLVQQAQPLIQRNLIMQKRRDADRCFRFQEHRDFLVCRKAIPLLIAGAVLAVWPSSANAQGYSWVKQISMSGPATGYKVAVDRSTNVYVFGSFQGTATFQGTTLVSRGGDDAFLAKFDNNGTLAWVKQAGGPGQDLGTDVAVDPNGNIYVTGSFQATAAFDTTNLVAVGSLSAGTVNNLFIAKYSPNGDVVWARRAGGVGGGAGLGIAVDANGNTFCTGNYQDFSGIYSILIDKRNAAGNIVWHQELPALPNFFVVSQGHSIKVDPSGNVYVAGQFGTTISFGSTVLSDTYLPDIFLTKLDASGNFLWAVKAGGDSDAAATSLAIDAFGNSLFTGYFINTATFGNTNLTTRVNDNRSSDTFVAKYDSAGNFVWVRQISRNTANRGTRIAVDGAGDAYVTGYLGTWQTFISKLDPNGNVVWELDPGHSYYSSGYGAAFDAVSSNLYFVTWSSGDVAFDELSFTNSQGGDLFLSKISEQFPPVFVTQPQSSPPGFLAGGLYTFNAAVRSQYPVSYQWQLNGTNLAGATNATLTITNAQLADDGNYAVIASNAFGSSTSAVANLTVYFTISQLVNGTGTIAINPATPYFVGNTPVTFTAVTNPGLPFIGWGGDLSGTNNPVSLIITSNMYVVASFADSLTNIVIDNRDPRATFTGVWFSGTAWYPYGVDYAYAMGSPLPTATATFRPTIVAPGYYDVSVWVGWWTNFSANAPWTVTSSGGTVTTNLDETVPMLQWKLIAPGVYFDAGTNGFVSALNNTGESNRVVVADAVRFIPSTPPRIASGPQPQTARAGTSATFTVWAYGTPPFTYFWQLNGATVASGPSSALTLSQIQPSMAGSYSVLVSNVMGTVTSAGATLTVTPPGQPSLLSNSLNVNRQMQFTLAGDSGVTFSIETSTDLRTWTVLTNMLNLTGNIQFTDPNPADGLARFYRAKWLPQ